MATATSKRDVRYLYGIIDMGSNGIRFSITTLEPPTARIMPTLYQHRAGISLYDAQYSSNGQRQPISDEVISSVLTVLRQFKRTCDDFGVPSANITILATEATRTAINSEDFRGAIKASLGWSVTMLPKEEEGRIGAMGIASSLPAASGLVMDLGGGSTQLSWLIQNSDGISMPDSGAVSMPYGAAAMTRRLTEAQKTDSVKALKDEIKQAVKNAYSAIRVPASLEQNGSSLYLSGGGFRGWGYLLMSRQQPYPIPLINGFRASRKHFLETGSIKEAAAAALEDDDDSVFRISDRRATQVPAVALLVNALAEALPHITDIRFCQGGVREGWLYNSLPPDIRSQSPIVVASQPFASHSSQPIVDLLYQAVPQTYLPRGEQGSTDGDDALLSKSVVTAFAQLMYYHSSHSKDIQAAAALRSTTTGLLASTHGVLHESRAALALLLCARWGSSLAPTDEPLKRSLEALVDPPVLWWIGYIGAVASLIAACHPAGVVDKPRLRLDARQAVDSKGRPSIALHISHGNDVDPEELADHIKSIEKLGKPKRWIGGKDGVGFKVEIVTEAVKLE